MKLLTTGASEQTACKMWRQYINVRELTVRVPTG